jgi:D-glycero-D-manno-heptose 1,7-bisphosphate phosphatase
MVGDQIADVQAACEAGCRPILVRTGHTKWQQAAASPPCHVVEDLTAAADLILSGALAC